ncbi:hypothetical protein ABIE21_003041 [Conyzicola nivalis]|uniref:Uncharacterized protein n=1 Tax=Conyzicola nivalis TaxID=1477021 RepID=A0ABV2QSH6_9MICO
MISLSNARRIVAGAISAIVLTAGVVVGVAAPAQAADPATFDPGYIISDQRFFDSGAMDEAAIQSFLRSKLPSCAQANGVACLPNFTESTPSRDATTRCAAYPGAANEPASRIINKVAKACGINPQVLVVTLQKENGLVTNGSPIAGSYRTAMGYACPDTAACDSTYFGFFNQVYSAASQFIRYGVNPASWRYRVGSIAVQYHPNVACGSSVVNIRNRATAALYNYTPYQPNAAAMANLYRTGDACSSYGNRNFWAYFTDWFGSTTGPVNPFGYVDAVTPGVGQIAVKGWAIDPDSTASLDIHIYVDGVGTSVNANESRPDLAAPYPNSGTAHGFSSLIPVGFGGAHEVCVYAINTGPGTHSLLQCSTVVTPGGPPTGYIDSTVASEGAVTVGGWAIDPDTVAPVQVHVYVDSASVAVNANIQRSDIAAAFPAYGGAHGFSTTVPASPGPHQVCAFAINLGVGGNTALGCVQVTVPYPAGTIPELGRAPIGYIDSTVVSAGAVTVGGWSIDPDTAAPIQVHVYVGATGVALTANIDRADIASAFPAYGGAHGYSAKINAAPGTHNVCAYGINTAPGGNSSLGCVQVTIPAPAGGAIVEQGRAPIGYLDSAVVSAGAVTVGGWSIDPDTASPISVHVYLDSASVAVPANIERGDIAAAYPLYGGGHGFSTQMAATPGVHRVCAYAINNAGGGNSALGCATVTVP